MTVSTKCVMSAAAFALALVALSDPASANPGLSDRVRAVAPASANPHEVIRRAVRLPRRTAAVTGTPSRDHCRSLAGRPAMPGATSPNRGAD